MKERYFLKILSKYSFLFGISNYLIFTGNNFVLSLLLFLWFILLVFTSCLLKDKKTNFFILPLVLMCIPALFMTKINDIILVAIISIFSIVFILKDRYKAIYYSSKTRLSKGIFVVFIIFLFSHFAYDITRFENVLLPYFLVYLVSSIILAKNTRNTVLTNKNRIINIVSSLCVLSIVFILSINSVRKTLFLMISKFISLLEYLLIYIVLLILKLLHLDKFYPKFDSKTYKADYHTGFKHNKIIQNHHNTVIFNYILLTIAIILIIFLIIKIIKIIKNLQKNHILSNSPEEYIETSEFIFNLDILKHKNNLINTLKKNIFPKNNRNKIRHYYYKYMKKCIKENICLNKSDTSYDINKKSKNIFDLNVIDSMRKIYIKIRYTNSAVTDTDVAKFIDQYNKLHVNRKSNN
ncbi:hypothetical protein CLTEP_04770 [Clostridium tepidiprofundi DSM 19306]|uniref:DUF4129 domain-containing protein n=1 Tax=Clostridium tepidiprofundi DSM 19306 TaxID=1121338 RepID=A0A151B6I3_9CLOT|nr:hypothetical protein [Clostridium tepidiprofundi]KYH35538.1 hypothetical protein CLTEP_04770 [Clostridium tepidiprofundi DSM 19306]